MLNFWNASFLISNVMLIFVNSLTIINELGFTYSENSGDKLLSVILGIAVWLCWINTLHIFSRYPGFKTVFDLI